MIQCVPSPGLESPVVETISDNGKKAKNHQILSHLQARHILVTIMKQMEMTGHQQTIEYWSDYKDESIIEVIRVDVVRRQGKTT